MAEEKIVVMTATELEQRPLRDRLGDWERAGRRVVWRVGGMGAGAMAAATVAAVRAERPGVVVLVGIGGARPGVSLEVAESVLVGSDRQADLGAWRSETGCFEPFDGWAEEAETIVCPYAKWLRDRFRVSGARSVNAACAPVPWRDGEEVESMEGAAFFGACRMAGVAFLQLRAISNRVGDRRDAWRIPEALRSLADALEGLLNAPELLNLRDRG